MPNLSKNFFTFVHSIISLLPLEINPPPPKNKWRDAKWTSSFSKPKAAKKRMKPELRRNGCCRRVELGRCYKWQFYQNWQHFSIRIEGFSLFFFTHLTSFGRTFLNNSFFFRVLECDGALFHQITLKVSQNFIFFFSNLNLQKHLTQ